MNEASQWRFALGQQIGKADAEAQGVGWDARETRFSHSIETHANVICCIVLPFMPGQTYPRQVKYPPEGE